MSDAESSPALNTHDSGMAAKDPAKRRRALWMVAAVFLLAALIWFLLWLAVFSTRESTDNAYVGGNQVALTSQVPGTVVAILTDDTQHVTAGQILVKLDPTDADVRLRQTSSALAQAVRQARQQNDAVNEADATVASREIELRQAEADLKRHLPLVAAQAESPEIVQHMRDNVRRAQAALLAAKARARSASAAVEGTDIATHPAVMQARANFRAAWIDAQRNTIVAPVSGYVAQRSVQLGASITPGQQLMTIVPLHDLWIEANFKENQLRHIRVGQPVKITTDLYGGSVTYQGKVIGLGAGTGSVFALLPAQNATGNWIKVVQRVPVRIALNNAELDKHPLRVGLSSKVTVDIRHDQGPVLAGVSNQPSAQTTVYDEVAAQADAQAEKIIRANLGELKL